MTTHTASMLQGLLRQLPVLGKIHRQLCCAISGIRTGPRAGATHHESEVGKRADTLVVQERGRCIGEQAADIVALDDLGY